MVKTLREDGRVRGRPEKLEGVAEAAVKAVCLIRDAVGAPGPMIPRA